MDKPIVEPYIPYIGPIYGGNLTPRKIVRIQGTTSVTGYRFSIYLQCGSETVPRDDVALLVTVRLVDGCVGLNSLQNGTWGTEQVGPPTTIKRGTNFEITLRCNFNEYEVVVNGDHYCDYFQTIPSDHITHLAIDGDVSIAKISYEVTALNDGTDSRSLSRSPAPLSLPEDFAAVDEDFNDSDNQGELLIDAVPAVKLVPGVPHETPVITAYPPEHDVQDNVVGPEFLFEKRSDMIRYWLICGGVFMIVVIISVLIIVTVVQVSKPNAALLIGNDTDASPSHKNNSWPIEQP